MQEIEVLSERMRKFEKSINANKDSRVHKDNKFNKQFSVLLLDWHYLQIITKRIEAASSEDSTRLGLDLKSLYVFARVYSETLIYIVSLFVGSSKKINWTKIGPFIKSVELNFNTEPDEFKIFWKANETPIRKLAGTFNYRNDVLHSKDSNTEWTFVQPGRSNLDSVYIVSVPWPEDKHVKKEKRTLNARDLINVLNSESSTIFSFLDSIK